MSKRGGLHTAYCCFVRDQLPGLRERGVPVKRVVDAIPYCSQAWALLTKEEKMVYMEKARKHNGKKSSQVTEAHPVPAHLTTKMTSVASLLDASDPAVITDIFYFLNIYSHGKLPSHCEQRFLPCEIGCVKYSLQDGIIADFHHFIDPEAPPRGFRYHCQADSDATHKIPISGFHLSRACYAVVLQELLEFVQPARGVQPHFYCRCDDRFRVSWCLNRMATVTGIEKHLELFAVEDLIIQLYQKKYQKEPSKTWICRELDAFVWDFCSNTRCKWHEENDIAYCALASCKKIAYCISRSLASVYGVSLTAAHLPEDSDDSERRNTKTVILDAGRFQKGKAAHSECDRHLASPRPNQEPVLSNCASPRGVKNVLYEASTTRGRGITRFLRSASDLSQVCQ